VLKLPVAEAAVDSPGHSSVRRLRRHTRLLGAVDSEAEKPMKRSPCHPNYCRNGGACKLDRRQHSGFRCVCKPKYSGLRCDNGRPTAPLNVYYARPNPVYHHHHHQFGRSQTKNLMPRPQALIVIGIAIDYNRGSKFHHTAITIDYNSKYWQ